MNPKAQTQFVQALVHATCTYLYCVIKNMSTKINKNCGILRNIQYYYGIAKNGMLYIHSLLWLINALNPSEFIQQIKNGETFKMVKW
jgi:hypothetical protein